MKAQFNKLLIVLFAIHICLVSSSSLKQKLLKLKSNPVVSMNENLLDDMLQETQREFKMAFNNILKVNSFYFHMI